MLSSGHTSERLAALAAFGVVLFNPPLLDLFDGGAAITVFGVPVLYAYLFIAWGALVALTAVAIEGAARRGAAPPAADDDAAPGNG